MQFNRFFSRLAAGLVLLAALPAVQPASAQTLKMVAHSDLKVLDPIWTTAFITRNHGYMVYDVLFAKDEQLRIQPQMVDKYTISPDRMTYTFTLRDGLEWHDGQPVTAEDCVASIKRWGARDALGQQMMASIGEMKPVDAKTFTIVLKEPFGLVLEALKERGEDGLLGIDAIAETYWHIHRQPKTAWAQEVDLRPYKEPF